MCGIWALIGKSGISYETLFKAFMKIKHRGPDRSEFFMVEDILPVMVCFHRLSIMDLTSRADQPFVWESNGSTNYCICNGEIYNYKKLIEKYDLHPESDSDCHVIPLLYEKIGIDKLLEELNGEFSFLIITLKHSEKIIDIYACTDPCSVRPLFYLEDSTSIAFSSELIGLINDNKPLFGEVKRFPPGHIMHVKFEKETITKNIYKYFDIESDESLVDQYNLNDYECAKNAIREVFTQCVVDRLYAYRPIGAFLSGGLDSSLICSIASKYLKDVKNETLETFSIGMPDATDPICAKKISEFIGSKHYNYTLSEQDFIDHLENKVIEHIGSYDITTVRASTGQDLLSYKISQDTNIKVLLSGDGSDELTGGYKYFHNAPSEKEFHDECIFRMNDICLYDGLRVDRGVSANGLEVRVPFLDKRFIKLYLSIPVKFRVPYKGIEKYLLRDAFRGYLPDDLLFRSKEAFSDGVSSMKKSWFQIIQEKADEKYSSTWEDEVNKYKINTPYSSEGLYYRKIFESIYGDDKSVAETIPYFWLPKWSGGIKEPSARVLDVY